MDKLYTINEVATRLNLSDKTLRRWEEAGRFTPSRTLGNQRRYSLDDLQILDAIKHNVITEQKELLNASQAASLCGVTPATLSRWENEGKIHPFITSGYTFYPKSRLLSKLAELRAEPPDQLPEPLPPPPPIISAPIITPTFQPSRSNIFLTHKSYILNLVSSLLLILIYHLVFTRPRALPLSPQSSTPGSVQGVTSAFDPRVDELLIKFQAQQERDLLAGSRPNVYNVNLAGTNVVAGSASLPKGGTQASVPHTALTSTSLVTATFTSDFSPAKKYWITPYQGSFTLTTDFPVGQDSTFNYQFLTPLATPSAL